MNFSDCLCCNNVSVTPTVMHTGNASAPKFISTKFHEPNNGSCTLSVEWSEAIVSCDGSVSQYVMSVTPPISDCQSGNCEIMTNRTHYNMTLTVDKTYTLTLRADTCSNTLQSENESVSISTHTGCSIILFCCYYNNIIYEFFYCD